MTDQPDPDGLDDQAAPELTAEEARDLADELGTELYRAQDALAFVEECCVIADREGHHVSTADVREWLKGARCGRQLAADVRDHAALRDRIAEALMRWAEGNNNPQYASMRRSETVRANAYSRADAVLAALPAPADQATVLLGAAEPTEQPRLNITPLPADQLAADEVFVDPAAFRAAVYAEVADRLAADAEQGAKEGFTRIYRRSAAKQVREWGEELRRVAADTRHDDTIWLERRPCGCIVSAVVAHVPGEWTLTTAEDVALHFHPTQGERRRAAEAGLTVEPVTSAQYREQFRSGWHCNRHAAAQQQPKETKIQEPCGAREPEPRTGTSPCVLPAGHGGTRHQDKWTNQWPAVAQQQPKEV